MSAGTPPPGHLRVTTGRLALPVEIRDRRMRLVDRSLSDEWSRSGARSRERSITLDPGIYMVSARLPGGRQLAEAVEVRAGGDHSVDLTPEPEALVPRAHYTTPPGLAAEARLADQVVLPSAPPPDWAFRFLRLEGLFRAVPDPSPRYHLTIESPPGSYTFRIEGSRTAVGFVQIARSAEVPLNVVLPAGGGSRRCFLAVEERAGLLDMSALPGGELAGRAAQFLAAGEEEHAALLFSGEEAESLLFAKITDPIGAAVGGYVLLRLHELERTHNWTDNLAAWFGWLPDGAVIAGEKAAMLGDHLRALIYFLQAGQRGLPVFTDGFSILVSRLRQYQANAHIHAQPTEEQAADVRALSARLEEWSPFVDFSALTRTFRAASPTQPTESQHPVEIGEEFISWRDLWRR